VFVVGFLRKLATGAGLAALTSLVLEYGGYLPGQSEYFHWLYLAIIVVFVMEAVVRLAAARARLRHLREHLAEYVALALALAGLAVAYTLARAEVVGHIVRIIVVAYLVFKIILAGVDLQRWILKASAGPARALVASFLIVIVVGSFLLHSPRAAATERIGYIDALFTSFSATCVTGLVVVDTGTDYSLFGQLVILALIQVGGLGIMTFTGLFALMLGQEMSLRETELVKDSFDAEMVGKVARLVVSVFVVTALAEILGALCLYRVWDDPAAMGVARRWYYSVFHSISAFCNAGFSLYSTSFERYRGLWQLNLVVTVLIVLGGIGVAVQRNIFAVTKGALGRLLKRVSVFKAIEAKRAAGLSLQTKLVLATTGALLLVGFICMALLERGRSMARLGAAELVQAAWFQSVTPRTAGFNTVDFSRVSPATKMLTIFFMFVGGSPGSTAGGIKTTTFAVLCLALVSYLRNRDEVEGFRRTIPAGVVNRAAAVTMFSLALVVLFTILVCVTDGARFELDRIAFEVVSAFGTVGLSTGITKELSNAGKILVSAAMFVGRVGPLTIAFAVGRRLRRRDFNYPSENVMVG